MLVPADIAVCVDRPRDTPLVLIGDRFALPVRFTATFTPLREIAGVSAGSYPSREDDPTRSICRMQLAVRSGRTVCEEIHIQRGVDGKSLDGSDLRAVPVASYIKRAADAAGYWVLPKPTAANPNPFPALTLEGSNVEIAATIPGAIEPFDEERIAVRMAGLEVITSTEAYRDGGRSRSAVEVADVYRRAFVRNQAPTKAVMDEWNVSRSTASRMVKRARAAGFLGAAVPRVAGEAPVSKRLTD